MSSTLLETARTLLQNAASVTGFSGAGLSAESGISTFRDTETHALWSRFDPMKLASPEGFAEAPSTVIDWYNWRRQTLATARPNAGHQALAQHPQLVQITQNVDDLLERAGCAPQQILHLHGTITRDRCHDNCGYSEAVDLTHPPGLRDCPRCGGSLRPAVVWFGESLPQNAWTAAEALCAATGCLLVIGTSASVYPAAGLIQLARRRGARIILVNTQPSDASHLADVELIGPSGQILPELLNGLSLASPALSD